MALKRILWGALLAYTALHLTYSVVRYDVFSGLSSGDFNRAYGESMEWKSFLNASAQRWHFHPPFYYTILLGVDALLGGRQNVVYFFYGIQFLLFPLAIVCLVKTVWEGQGRPSWAAYGVAAVLAVNFQPFLETLAQHKVEGLEFVLICVALLAFRRGRDLWCGSLLMLAANLKYLPALLLVHFGAKREWKRQEREEKWPRHLLEISLTLVMILVISQASRVHYAILALPAFLIVGLILYQQGRTFPLREKLLFGLAYACTGMLIPGGLLNRLPPHPVWGRMHSLMYLWWSLPFYGVLLLGFCAMLMYHRILKQGVTS